MSLSSRSSLETDHSGLDLENNEIAPIQSLSSSLSHPAYRVRSFGSSLASKVSRVNTLRRNISTNIRSAAERIQDDSAKHAKDEAIKRSTRLGRGMSNLGLEEAIRIATYRSENQLSLSPENKEEEADLEKVVTGEVSGENVPPQDKGYAWVMAGCGFMLLFATWGANGAYGVFLSYWINNQTFPGGTAKDYALIGSMVLCLSQSLAPLAQMLSAIVGIRPVMIVGVILQFLGFILGSYAKTLTQLYLTQGFILGLGVSLVFNPMNTLMPEWFDKKRGISSGITVSASGVGGVLFSLASQSLINDTGNFRWSLRMIGIICVVFEIILTILTKPRIPKRRLKTVHEIRTRASVMFNVRIVKLCQQVGSDMTAIFNGCQAIGRLAIGLCSDYTGRVNLALILNVVMIVLIFAMWINSFSYTCVLMYSILSGLTFGSASTLNQPILADQVEPELFPSAWSFENFFMGIWSLVVEVITLGLRDEGKKRPFIRSQICAGFFSVGGLFFLIPIRELKIRLFLEKNLNKTDQTLAKDIDLTTEDTALLEKRKAHYNKMLQPGIHAYFKRLIHPIAV
ncbi:hypothetical protein FOA43_000251 [Brettanomyces nanus]|uniref:Major facilitator superfamily (MFS) profile domain-containing protein n=1 Tax=Eeniella nana TaxID=13502 RepID=A0A875RSX1_EENNA|nr:uncharacterized protein FOA43_000251 [Brettanomyces nanus]QPG72947.1 hypothetical protein FOA43_000251 [Brettanomyces nanus]